LNTESNRACIHGRNESPRQHAAIAAETVTGYITINDAAGTPRKLAVVS